MHEIDPIYGDRISPELFECDAVTVAKALLNCILVHQSPEGITAARISETEAYTQDDAASHSHRGKTVRNSVMFGPGGLLYVYFTYGMHYCANVVTASEGQGEAVLLRSAEPLLGMELMLRRRGLTEERIDDACPATAKERFMRKLCGGPSRLASCFGFDKTYNGANIITGDSVWLLTRAIEVDEHTQIVASRRIGITRNADTLWRFTLEGDRYTSRSGDARLTAR